MSVVHVAPDTLIVVPAGAWRGEGELTMKVSRPLHELNAFTPGGWVWLEGTRLDEEFGHHRWLQALVRIDALTEVVHIGP